MSQFFTDHHAPWRETVLWWTKGQCMLREAISRSLSWVLLAIISPPPPLFGQIFPGKSKSRRHFSIFILHLTLINNALLVIFNSISLVSRPLPLCNGPHHPVTVPSSSACLLGVATSLIQTLALCLYHYAHCPWWLHHLSWLHFLHVSIIGQTFLLNSQSRIKLSAGCFTQND